MPSFSDIISVIFTAKKKVLAIEQNNPSNTPP